MADDYKYPHSLASLTVLTGTRPPEPPVAAPVNAAPVVDAPTSPAGAVPSADAPTAPVDRMRQKLIEGQVIAACKQVFDPEIPVNIYDLGLIYDIAVDAEDRVIVKMTLTAPACPVAESLPIQVQQQIEAIPDVKDADVQLVWEPAWDRSRMSEEAMLTLGMF